MTANNNNERLKKNCVVVMPCYNSGGRVRSAAQNALAHVERVVVVDDGCTDDSMASLADLPLQTVRFSRNRGKGHALIAGVRAALEMAEVQVIALMDADGQHDANALPGLFDRFKEEAADLVIGARQFDKRQVPWRSRFGNRVTVWVMAKLCGRRLPDTQCGFRLLSPRFARAFVAHVPGGRYETEMRMLLLAIQRDYRIVSAPIATLYEPGNPSSHFRKFQDSLRVYTALIQQLFARKKWEEDGDV